jgi:hypothetical protein
MVSQTMPSSEYASAMALAGFGVSEPSSASLLTAKIFWRRSRWVVIWVLTGRASGITKEARGEVCRPRLCRLRTAGYGRFPEYPELHSAEAEE